MDIGDVVTPAGNFCLRNIHRQYNCAIVCWLDPFILVSVDATEIWHLAMRQHEFQVLCKADRDVIHQCMKRLPEEYLKQYKATRQRTAAEMYSAMVEHDEEAMIKSLERSTQKIGANAPNTDFGHSGSEPAISTGDAPNQPTPEQQLKDVRRAIESYYAALDSREHGGIAQNRAFESIQQILGMHWVQGASRPPSATPTQDTTK